MRVSVDEDVKLWVCGVWVMKCGDGVRVSVNCEGVVG